jgi:hypothetical protein
VTETPGATSTAVSITAGWVMLPVSAMAAVTAAAMATGRIPRTIRRPR